MRPSLEELAAHLGDQTATPPIGAHHDHDAESDFAAWAWEFSRWGQETMARAALAAASFALPAWEGYEPSDAFDGGVLGGPDLRRMLDTLTAYLANEPGAAADLAETAARTRAMVERASLYVHETSGNEGTVTRRERARAVAHAALAALDTVMWSESDLRRAGLASGIDSTELNARAAVGPALHVVTALSCACRATGASAARIRAELRRVLL